MDGLTLHQVMTQDPHAAPLFEGVFAADTLPRYLHKKPAYFIMNTDPIRKPGQHWLAVSIDCHGRGEYFDSYGQPPYITEHRKFLDRHCKSWRYNHLDLQALDSVVCGQYCVMYLLHKAHGYSLPDFVNMYFTDDCNKNDKLVEQMFHRYMKNVKLCDDISVKKNQTCCMRKK